MANREHLPDGLRREVLVEAGHRCAIPTCRQPTVDVAHIIPYAQVLEHSFGNLIALCPNDHRRFHQGEIDRQAILMYKANLSIIASRYGELERRLLEWFAQHPRVRDIELPGGFELLVRNLVDDKLLLDVGPPDAAAEVAPGRFMFIGYHLTVKGASFIERWTKAEELPEL